MPTITGDAVVELIRNDERGFAGTGDIADHFDVTRQSVRNRLEALRHHPELRVDKIGQSTVFYVAGDGGEVENQDETAKDDDGMPEQLHMDPRARRVGGAALVVALLASVLAAGLGGMIASLLVALAPALAAAGGVLVAISYVPELMEFSTEADSPEPDSATISE